MKKLYVLGALFLGLISQAQVTFNPGIRAGVNLSHFTNSPYVDYYDYYNGSNIYEITDYRQYDIKTKVDFYVGFQANIRFAKMYALQPEIFYSRQGAQLKHDTQTINFSVSYLGAAVVNKFYIDQFNVQVGPTLEFEIDSRNFEPWNPVDLGITAGLGYDINNKIGVEARVKKGIVPVLNSNNGDHNNVAFQLGAYFTFSNK